MADPALDTAGLVTETETAWIPMADGRRLAARLFLPSEAGPSPVILEYIPYRRRDGTRLGDERMHRWFAAHGYAAARVDIAGSGDSDGLIEDEYVLREQDDGMAVIRWLADQPWCDGNVGLIGISWGGFNALQLAARRPPALRAIVTVCSTDDRYTGDVHFPGGCLNEENLEWGGVLFTLSCLPPDPAVVGERWRSMWRERIDGAVLNPAVWLEHQRRDEFWRHGSVCEDYSAIQIPVLAVGGWADAYTPAVFRLAQHLPGVCRGIVGPWGHKYPHDGVPGPAIGFLEECLRWWDRWLGERPTQVECDPGLRLWLQDPVIPAAHIAHRPGRWVGAPRRLPTGRTWHLTGDTLDIEPPVDGDTRSICSPVTVGLAAGQWCPYGQGTIAPDLPYDQRVDDLGSLTFDTEDLTAEIVLVGTPLATLRLSADRPAAVIAVRLNDVRPDGTVQRLSYGLLNLAHRSGHDDPRAVVPGEVVDVTVPMTPIAQRVPAGHRLRLAISTAYWPMTWPSPALATVTVHQPGSAVELPVHDGWEEIAGDPFAPPSGAVQGASRVVDAGIESRRIVRHLGEARTDFFAERDDGTYVLDDIGTEQRFHRVRTMSVVDDDPLSATARQTCSVSYRREDWDASVRTVVAMECDAEWFHVRATLIATDRGEPFAERHFAHDIPRLHR